MTAQPSPYERWRSIRERAFGAHVAATDDRGRAVATAWFVQGMHGLRRALDEDELASFDAMFLRDYETLLLAEATVDGAPCPKRLRAIVLREITTGRMDAGDAIALRHVGDAGASATG